MKWRLHANCIPVKGASRSLICDLQRNNYEFIPNSLYELLNNYSDLNIDSLLRIYGNEHRKTFEEYITFLKNKEFVFSVLPNETFPAISLEWKSPNQLQNAIIDTDKNSVHNYIKIAKELEELRCEHLEMRFFDEINLEELKTILDLFQESTIYSIHLILKYNENWRSRNYLNLIRRQLRISQILVHSSPYEEVYENIEYIIEKGVLYFSKQKITSEKHCGVIHPAYFAINSTVFNEAQNYNTCLNGKISIDKNGDIKNCPSMNKSFGNHKTITLLKVYEELKLSKLWKTNKDQINICKDCEFRYLCIDCRAYTENDNPLGKPEKCNYDPYTAKWRKP